MVVERIMGYPWYVLYNWQPFRIDALGLITLLGSDEVNNYIGRLVSSRWLEYMPLLGAFVIAGDRFKEKKPSFNIYNISSGINTSDLSSWFTRWMLAQELEVTRSVVYWEVVDTPRKWWPYHVIAAGISFCFTGLLIAMAVLSEDWYGLTNAVAIITSIIVRAYILRANRCAINKAALKANPLKGTLRHATKEWEKQQGRGYLSEPPSAVSKPGGMHWRPELAKIMIVMSDAKAITMFIPEQLVVPVFVNNPKPDVAWLYALLRWVGWVAFGAQIIAIGMTKLVAQMYTVALLVVPTVLVCWKVGCDDSRMYRRLRMFSSNDVDTPYECWVGSHLKATVFQWPEDVEFEETEKGSHAWRLQEPGKVKKRSTRRQDLFAWLNLTAEEEDSLGKWDLLPHMRNHDDTWANDFDAKKGLIRQRPTDIEAIKNAVTHEIERRKLTARFFGAKRKLDNEESSNRDIARYGNPLLARTDQRMKTTITASGFPNSAASAPVAVSWSFTNGHESKVARESVQSMES